MSELKILEIGDTVHYVSYGSADGTYPSTCRAAIVTQIVPNTDGIGVAVLNPTGMFFNTEIPWATVHGQGVGGEPTQAKQMKGGTWHGPGECR